MIALGRFWNLLRIIIEEAVMGFVIALPILWTEHALTRRANRDWTDYEAEVAEDSEPLEALDALAERVEALEDLLSQWETGLPEE